MAYSLLQERIEISDAFLDVLYKCLMDGSCDISCKVQQDIEPLQLMQELRIKCVEDGQLLPEHMIVIEGLQKEDNMMQSSKAERGKWAEGLDIKSRLLRGAPFLEIIKELVRGGHDLVIKPAEGRGGVSSLLFGSTDLHLLRKCPCPVWIIKPTKRKKHARILAAVDPDPGEKANAEFNTLILDLATSLAQREQRAAHSARLEHGLRGQAAQRPRSPAEIRRGPAGA